MPYRIEFRPRAEKQLQSLPRAMQLRIVSAVDALADDPRPQGVRKLTGSDDLYRIRVGDYRIIYEVRDKLLLILIVRIGHRRDVYEGGK